MENKETILQELKQISEVVANLPKGNTFTVPATYFEAFPASVLALIKAETADLGVKITPFGVPNGYFDGLADSVLDKIKQQEQQPVEEELNELAPLLNTISKKPVYTVPEGYFESLEVTIPLKVATPARVVGFRPRRILQYAIAACTAGILMVGAYLYTHRTTGTDTTTTASAVIPYDSAVKMDVNEELANVNEQEIDQYFAESPTVGGYFLNASTSDEVDVDQFIKSASDEEIKEYLNQTTEPSTRNSGT